MTYLIIKKTSTVNNYYTILNLLNILNVKAFLLNTYINIIKIIFFYSKNYLSRYISLQTHTKIIKTKKYHCCIE